tara:strand:- start:126 stop:461 length:336 start_codon:yes stop_codon:yes gene_type:complete
MKMEKIKFEIVKYDKTLETKSGYLAKKGTVIEGKKLFLDVCLDKRSYENGRTFWVASEKETGLSFYSGALSRKSALAFACARMHSLGENGTLANISRFPTIAQRKREAYES